MKNEDMPNIASEKNTNGVNGLIEKAKGDNKVLIGGIAGVLAVIVIIILVVMLVGGSGARGVAKSYLKAVKNCDGTKMANLMPKGYFEDNEEKKEFKEEFKDTCKESKEDGKKLVSYKVLYVDSLDKEEKENYIDRLTDINDFDPEKIKDVKVVGIKAVYKEDGEKSTMRSNMYIFKYKGKWVTLG